MSVQHPYFIQKENFTESRVALASEILQCNEQPGFLFTTPGYVIHSHQKLQDIQVAEHSQLRDWLQQARLQLEQAIEQGHRNASIMGGIPFGNAGDLNLMLMQDATIHQKVLYLQADYALQHDADLQQASFIPSGAEYQTQVAYLVQQMQAGQLDKAVLARILQLDFSAQIAVSELFYNLARHNQEGYNYAVSRNPGQEGWFVGASPELLVAKQGAQIWSKPVAGTLARDDDPVQDQHNAKQLLASAKDQHEHAVVTEMIADQLSPFCKKLHIPRQPSLIRTRRLWHLATRIEGELKHADTHVFDLVERLHPTPAICGQPTDIARSLIQELEPFNRELFAGTMGWADGQGNGEWSVTVRSARIYRNIARLFAGAGIVAASSPQAEHAETAAKFRTVLDGFGLTPTQITP
ncbi:isochorismate synthase [Acinetobacter sp. WZC-1]|uniref:isochorismate synthase n=1 Tax=Acinetobacter sp. WZC-1 TaxID=3459034 RepID=UPI00403D692C